MEQRDYLLKEIEKIGLLLRMILDKLTLKKENFAITIEKQFEESKELLFHEIGFDFNRFLSLEKSEIEHYLSKFNGVNGANIELLADILKEMGTNTDSEDTKIYLEKALSLFELCNSLDKTFSFEREAKISQIKNALSS